MNSRLGSDIMAAARSAPPFFSEGRIHSAFAACE